jgi:hypothetical protein
VKVRRQDLGEAIAENAGKLFIPWEEAKKDLDLGPRSGARWLDINVLGR